jgi:hypothetical protein
MTFVVVLMGQQGNDEIFYNLKGGKNSMKLVFHRDNDPKWRLFQDVQFEIPDQPAESHQRLRD